MVEKPDWTHGGQHMFSTHGVTVAEANEALDDVQRIEIIPDYNSRSGLTTRTIGHSATAGCLLSIITLTDNGTIYVVNGWKSNSRDRTIYQEAKHQ
ncbi:MAG: hypothetical protein LBB54_04565 [Cellulomonadaceae bacterium]|jgi:uncharacterized DUF497 family protein|nr:hypothetical protein [Cellulomonadaceae bacterium]